MLESLINQLKCQGIDTNIIIGDSILTITGKNEREPRIKVLLTCGHTKEIDPRGISREYCRFCDDFFGREKE